MGARALSTRHDAKNAPPEVHQYRARRRDDDQPVGDWSGIAQVTARP